MGMRITSAMINNRSKTNIFGTKTLTDKYNEQMTSQKKIEKPSDDPVVAIRSLRLRDSLHEVEQYTDKNIPDASSWLSVTETSLNNVSNVLKEIYGMCVNGATGTLTTDDRNTILSNLSAYVDQIYSEGNTEYAGRTIFTGFKTNKTLTFQETTPTLRYSIDQKLSFENIETGTYSKNLLAFPMSAQDMLNNVPEIEDEYEAVHIDRIRLAYKEIDSATAPTIKLLNKDTGELTDIDLSVVCVTTNDLEAAGYDLDALAAPLYPDDDTKDPYAADAADRPSGNIILNTETGELLLPDAEYFKKNNIQIQITYDKKGFDDGEVRPEMLFDCREYDEFDVVKNTFKREAQDINYTVAGNQLLNVNTQASQDGVFTTTIRRDVEELMNAVTAAQKANEKVDYIKTLLENPMYADEDSQSKFKTWLTAAEKEVTYTTENLKDIFSKGITKFQDYKQTVDLAKTDVGSREKRLELTKTRMTAQKSSLQNLIHTNEDREMSDILIDFETAYQAYEASLKAASEVNKMSLLNFL